MGFPLGFHTVSIGIPHGFHRVSMGCPPGFHSFFPRGFYRVSIGFQLSLGLRLGLILGRASVGLLLGFSWVSVGLR